MTTPTEQRVSRNQAFIEHVRRISVDPGINARLRRSLRKGDVIGDDAWWLLGAWLPADVDTALIMARVAAWCAAHRRAEMEPWRTLPREIAAARTISKDVARRTIEGVTAEGMATSIRIDRANRAIEMLPGPVRIDWAYMISNLVAFSHGGDRAHAVKHRWYLDYHASPQDNNDQTEGDTSDD